MNFNAKDDFVIEQEIREEQEQLAEERQATEEDNCFDTKRDIPDMTPDEEDAFENERQGGKSIFDDEPEEETDCE